MPPPRTLPADSVLELPRHESGQVEHNRESTERQYALAGKARDLGWPEDRILVIDEDLGLSGSGSVARSGFARCPTVAFAIMLAASNAVDVPKLEAFTSMIETVKAKRSKQSR